MKHAVAVVIGMLLLCHTSARGEGFSLEMGHFDPQGRLTTSANGIDPLPDGCLGQAIVDMGDDGIAVPAVDGSPGAGDALLNVAAADYRDDGTPVTFVVNGTTTLDMPGCFLSASFTGAIIPSHRIFLRVWNASDPQDATGYWDSPPYQILFGPQQVSFARSEWCWNTFSSAAHKDPPLATQSGLSAYPNPFNSSSRISFDLREDGVVKLAVYDLQARLVRTLVDGPLMGGHHDLTFDAARLPSGLYFLRLQAGHDVSQVTRLLLLR